MRNIMCKLPEATKSLATLGKLEIALCGWTLSWKWKS